MQARLQSWGRALAQAWLSPRCVWVIVALGLLVRLADLIHNRSLWLDESKIVANILQRSFGELTLPLDHEQGAPLAWLWLVKAATLAFGTGERALRLVSFLAGSAALVLFPLAARRLLTRGALPLATLLFATSMSLLYFGFEAKQYIVDVLAAVLLLALLPEEPDDPAAPAPRWRAYLPLALAGGLLVPLSHPAVFLLAGLCLTWGVGDLARRRFAALRIHAALGALWGGCILLNYFLFLRTLGGNDHLLKFWADDFMPAPWRLHESLPWLAESFFDLFEDEPLRFDSAVWPAIGLALLGVVAIFRRRPAHLALLLAPLGFVLLAAALRMYPFDSRLLLFLVPACYVLIAAGAAWFWSLLPGWGRVIPVALAIGVLAEQMEESGKVLARGTQQEELRPVLERVQHEIEPGDGIFLGPSVTITWRYYTQLYPAPLAFNGHRVLEYDGDDRNISNSLHREQQAAPLPARIWFVFVHFDDDDLENMLERLDAVGRRVEDAEIEREKAAAYLYEINSAPIPRDEPEDEDEDED